MSRSQRLPLLVSLFQRLCLSLLGRLVGSERDRLLKQAEVASPGDSADKREEMEVAMQQVGQQRASSPHSRVDRHLL